MSKIKSIEDAIESEAPSLVRISKAIGNVSVEAYVKVWLIDLNNSINTKRGLKESQIDEIAFKVVNKYRTLTVPDLHLIFGKAKEGGYGAFYDTLSMEKVIPWFEEYFEEKCQVGARIAQRKHDQLKYEEQKTPKIAKSSLGELRKVYSNEKK